MVLAIAALLFHLSPATAAQAESAADMDSTSTPVLFAANLPDAVPSVASLATVAASTGAPQPSGESSSASVTPEPLRAALRNSQSLSMIRVAEPESKPARFISAESLPSRRQWIALSIAQHAAAAFDAYTTRDAVSRGAVEQDPLMRPFANSSGIYAAIQAGPVVLDFVGRRMQRSDNGFLRRTWWVPQSVSTGMYLFSGAHNLRVANRQ